MKFYLKWFGLILACFLVGQGSASNLYIYKAPNGERVVTDRPIQLEGYMLEHNGLTASTAGRALKHQDSASNRAVIDQHIRTAAEIYQMEEALIRAVIRQESNFRIDARSVKGALGLMQLMPATARYYQVRDPFDPRENIHAGTRHLRYLLQHYNDLDLALAAYNAGQTAVLKYQGIPPFPETQQYVTSVKRRYQQYR